MTDLTCDVAIIGGGTAGLAAERAARAAGATTLLIDARLDGTTCALNGCMPSKLLIAASHAAQAVRRAGAFGVRARLESVDGAAVMDRVRRLRDRFNQGVIDSVDALPDGIVIKATAQFRDATTLLLDDGRTVGARAIVIATGSRPAVPAAFDAVRDLVLTNETIFDLPDLPASIAVIGAGPLGLEMAQALARLGVETVVLDRGDTLGGQADGPIADALRGVLIEDMAVHLGVEIDATREDGQARLAWTGASHGSRLVERVLVAAGRPPVLDTLDLAIAGLTLDDKRVPCFDRTTMQCGDAPIFLAGDADADQPVLHEASSEGAIAGRGAALWPERAPARRSVPLAIMFSDPPLAIVGDTRNPDAIVETASYADQGRATIDDVNVGLVRVHARRGDGGIIGAEIFAPGGEHLAHLFAWSIEQDQTATNILDRPFYHPTYEEGLKPALRAICKASGTKPPVERDEGDPAGA